MCDMLFKLLPGYMRIQSLPLVGQSNFLSYFMDITPADNDLHKDHVVVNKT